MSTTHQDRANFIWSVADLLRRLDCVLEPTKDVVVERYDQALPAYDMGTRWSMPDSVPGLAGESGVRL